MTTEDEVYASWLNLLGSDIYPAEPTGVAKDLHLMHDASEASHPAGTGAAT